MTQSNTSSHGVLKYLVSPRKADGSSSSPKGRDFWRIKNGERPGIGSALRQRRANRGSISIKKREQGGVV